jgi:hypothetical protein
MLSSIRYKPSNERMIMNHELEDVNKSSCSLPTLAWRDWGKPRNICARIFCLWTVNWTQDLRTPQPYGARGSNLEEGEGSNCPWNIWYDMRRICRKIKILDVKRERKTACQEDKIQTSLTDFWNSLTPNNRKQTTGNGTYHMRKLLAGSCRTIRQTHK